MLLLSSQSSQNRFSLGSMSSGLLVQAEIVACGQHLEANLDRNVHVWHVFAVTVAVPVVKILYHLVEYHGAVGRTRLAARLDPQTGSKFNQDWTAS